MKIFNKYYSWLWLVILAGGWLLTACGDSSATATAPSPVATTAIAPPSQTVPGTPTLAPVETTASNRTQPPLAVSVGATNTTPGQKTLATAQATIKKASGESVAMTVELARTSQEQETGLMGRSGLPDNWGMLFIFGQMGRVAFWMKDTPLALSIAFIDDKGKIVDIQDMAPFSLDTHSPNQDYLSALEVTKGYFAGKGIKPGDVFTMS